MSIYYDTKQMEKVPRGIQGQKSSKDMASYFSEIEFFLLLSLLCFAA